MSNPSPKTSLVLIVGLLVGLATFVIAGMAGVNEQNAETVRLGTDNFGTELSTQLFRWLLSTGAGLLVAWVSKKNPTLGNWLSNFVAGLIDRFDGDDDEKPEVTPVLNTSGDFGPADTLYDLSRKFALAGDPERAKEMCEASEGIIIEIAEDNLPEEPEPVVEAYNQTLPKPKAKKR